MPEWVPFLAFVAGLAAVMAAVVVLARRGERRRSEALRSTAAMLGFTLEPESQTPEDARFDPALSSLRRGRSSKIRNLMRGREIDGDVAVFDYRYTVSTGKSSHTVEQTVAGFRRHTFRLPSFRLQPENVFDRVAQVFGQQDIDIDSNPEFSNAYRLSGAEPDQVRSLFERQAASYLSSAPGWTVEGSGEWLLVFRAGVRVKPEQYSAFLEDTRRIARLFEAR